MQFRRALAHPRSYAAAAAAIPGRYATAVAERRQVRSLPAGLPFDQAFEFATSSIGMSQRREEIEWLYELVRELRPRTVLEIGLDSGGTLFLWSRAASADALLLAVDSARAWPFGRWSPFVLARRAFATGDQRVELLMDADSHDRATLARVRDSLRGRSLDFLFIDGDHSYEGARQDFEMYAALVRPGGLLAFHDVSPRPSADTEGTSRFWRDITAEHETEERVVGDESGFGIGVYRVPV